jgi:hypothetical protein
MPGGLAKGTIDGAVKEELPKIRDCYENHVKGVSPKPTGSVQTRFTVGPDGKVSKVEILGSELKNEKIEGCLAEALKGLSLPPPAGGGTVRVDYPFAFQPGPKPAKKGKKTP